MVDVPADRAGQITDRVDLAADGTGHRGGGRAEHVAGVQRTAVQAGARVVGGGEPAGDAGAAVYPRLVAVGVAPAVPAVGPGARAEPVGQRHRAETAGEPVGEVR